MVCNRAVPNQASPSENLTGTGQKWLKLESSSAENFSTSHMNEVLFMTGS